MSLTVYLLKSLDTLKIVRFRDVNRIQPLYELGQLKGFYVDGVERTFDLLIYTYEITA